METVKIIEILDNLLMEPNSMNTEVVEALTACKNLLTKDVANTKFEQIRSMNPIEFAKWLANYDDAKVDKWFSDTFCEHCVPSIDDQGREYFQCEKTETCPYLKTPLYDEMLTLWLESGVEE